MTDPICRARLALSIRNIALAHSYAHELMKYRFKVLKVTSRGISFQGTPDLFEHAFQSTLELSESGCAFSTEPVLPEVFNSAITSIYFPTKPVFFD